MDTLVREGRATAKALTAAWLPDGDLHGDEAPRLYLVPVLVIAVSQRD